MRPVLIDCDPGTDDALAICMALNSRALDVVGFTTVGGNAAIDDTTSNALALLETLGRAELPVWRGAARALVEEFTFAYDFHGTGGMGIQLEPPASRVRTEPAVEAIIAEVRARPGKLTLIALGPLTNVALALRRRPALASEVGEIIVMGGALQVSGNVTEHAEFNIYNDPTAAAVVFGSGAPVKLVGLDVTSKVAILRSEDPWLQDRSKTAMLARRILQSWFESHPDADQYSLHDPLTVAAAIDPTLLAYRPSTVAVDTRHGTTRGKTTPSYGHGPVHAALGVDADHARLQIEGLIRHQE